MLDIIRSGEEKAVKFALEGRLDTATVPKFEAELKGSEPPKTARADTTKSPDSASH